MKQHSRNHTDHLMTSQITDLKSDISAVSARSKKQRWMGYIVTLLFEALLTIGLLALLPYFPLGSLPIPYVLLMMLVAYLYGEGPAIIAFVVGLFVYDYFFVPPVHTLWPLDMKPEGWVRITAFFLGTSIVGFATLLMQRSNRRIQRLVEKVNRQSALLETFMYYVPVGLALHDRETRHVIANQALARINEKTLDEIIDKTVREASPEWIAEDITAAIDSVFATGQPSIKRSYAFTGQADRYFDIEYHPVRTAEGEIIGVGAVVIETTEQVMAHKLLQQQYDREHHIADILQSSLMGNVAERIGTFEFETLYKAALDEARVGGDFYDTFQLSENKIAIVIGDVSGKGLAAAVQVAMARCNLRGRLYDSESPAQALAQLNNILERDASGEHFVTIFAGVIDITARTLTYANGGHEPAMFWDSAAGCARILSPTGPLVGMIRNCAYDEKTLQLKCGDELLLSTDGLSEAQCSHGLIEIEELLHVYEELKHSGPSSAFELVKHVIDYCGNELRDDVAVLRVSVVE